MNVVDREGLVSVPRGSHVCWILNDESEYVEDAKRLISAGHAENEKVFVFGPLGDISLAELERAGGIATDPRVAFLEAGPLVPDTMYDAFRTQTRIALAEGFVGVRVIADMRWLLPVDASAEDVLKFELVLDRIVASVGATVVCAYFDSSFDHDTIHGIPTVHPVIAGTEEPPLFRIVDASGERWLLSGEVDLAVIKHFTAAMQATTTASTEPCVIDVSGMRFIDVAGMRAIANASATANSKVVLRGVKPSMARFWEIAGLRDTAPLVELDPNEADSAVGAPSN